MAVLIAVYANGPGKTLLSPPAAPDEVPDPTPTVHLTRTPFPTHTLTPDPADDPAEPTLEGGVTPTLAPQVTLPVDGPDSSPLHLIGDLPPVNTYPEVALEVDLHAEAQWARVWQRVAVKNTSAVAWKEVVLAIPLAAREGAFRLDAARVDDQKVKATLDGIMLHVPLVKLLGPTHVIQITLDFRVAASGVSAESSFPDGNNGVSGDVLRLGEWFPVIVPYDDGIGWRTWKYQPVGDPMVYPAQNVTLAVVADPGVTVVSGGLQSHSGTVWRFHVDGARGVPIFASAGYHEVDGKAGAYPVRSLYLGDDSTAAQRAIDIATNAISLYEDKYGPYPFKDLTIVQNGYHGDMEYSALVSISSRSYVLVGGAPANLLAIVVAHEVAHQWWYGGVGNDQVREPWLDESLASYSEVLYYQQYMPSGGSSRLASFIRRSRPMTLDSDIYDYIDTSEYVEAIYPRGVLFLRELNALIGDDAFFAFLHHYYDRYQGKLATTADFLSILRQHTSADLKPLLAQYFANPNP